MNKRYVLQTQATGNISIAQQSIRLRSGKRNVKKVSNPPANKNTLNINNKNEAPTRLIIRLEVFRDDILDLKID